MMMVKSFFSRRKPLRGISAVILGLVFGLICATASPSGDTAPDWVRAAAREPLPADMPKDAKAVVLYDETKALLGIEEFNGTCGHQWLPSKTRKGVVAPMQTIRMGCHIRDFACPREGR